MKKTNTPKKKLKLNKETIRTLDSKEMQQVKGAMNPTLNCRTQECDSEINCTLMGGGNHNQTFLRRRGR